MNKLNWNGGLQLEAVDVFSNEGGMIVSPSKVGYVILTTDKQGLEKLYESKNRDKGKPSVVICGSIEQLIELAEINDEIEKLITCHWNENITLGCILPWNEASYNKLPVNIRNLVMDKRKTSCFIIKPGTACELIAKEVWGKYNKILFASSANPSGKSNEGKVELVGSKIENNANLIICANDYVDSIQENTPDKKRYEQSVIISMVDDHGKLIPNQHKNKNINPCPTIIRKGLGIDKSMLFLANNFNSWAFKDGGCY